MLALWIALLVALGAGSAVAGGSFTSNFTVPGTQSQDANDLLAKRMPAPGGANGDIVFAAPHGRKLTAAQDAAIRRALASVSAVESVAAVSDPFALGGVSRDGRIAFAEVTLRVPSGRVTAAERRALAAATGSARSAGLAVAMNGDLVTSSTSDSTEALGVLIALIVLLVTFGSITAAGMPLRTAGVGVGAGALGILGLSAVTALDASAMSIAVMLGLAVGIDYALFIISRHRAQAQHGMEMADSVAHAVGTAGGAVVFAGSTVVVALLGLAVTGVPFLALMGACAAGTIVVSVAVALTLVPALLGFAGRRGRTRRTASGGRSAHGGSRS